MRLNSLTAEASDGTWFVIVRDDDTIITTGVLSTLDEALVWAHQVFELINALPDSWEGLEPPDLYDTMH